MPEIRASEADTIVLWVSGSGGSGAMSPYEARLTEQATQTEGRERWIARLKLSTFHARLGKDALALPALIEARVLLEGSSDAGLMARVNFCEGALEYSRGNLTAALEKVKRAQALALGCGGGDDMLSLASAWLASYYRMRGIWASVGSAFVQSLSHGRDCLSPEAMFRLALVIADLYHESGNFDRALPWYRVAHRHATSIGDEASISAMVFNRIAIATHNLRIRQATGDGVDDRVVAGLIDEVDSIDRYSQMVQEVGLLGSYDLLRAQLHLMQEQYSHALEMLTSSSVITAASRLPGPELVRRADVILCEMKTESRGVCVDVGEWEVACTDSKVDAGDSMIAAHSLAVAGVGDGLHGVFSKQLIRLRDARKEELSAAESATAFFEGLLN